MKSRLKSLDRLLKNGSNNRYLILGQSGRMLARFAFDAGVSVAVIDQYGDQDTQRYAQVTRAIPEFSDEIIFQTVADLADEFCFEAIILTSGFEARIDLLAELESRWMILGTSSESIALAKDPFFLAKLLSENEVFFPQTLQNSPQSAQWLVKQIGGCGGDHVAWFDRQYSYPKTTYYQKYQAGITGSVTFVGDGKEAHITGYSQTWTKGEGTFEYAGAISWNDFQHKEKLAVIVKKMTLLLGLKGLCGIDFILNVQGEIYILEINPRPVSTMDLHNSSARNLFLVHIEACLGKLPKTVVKISDFYAKATVYAGHDFIIPRISWPIWVADMPEYDQTIRKGTPVCTVYAEASGASRARKLVHNREREIKRLLSLEA